MVEADCMVTRPLALMANAAVVDVASAVEVAMKRELLIERKVQAFESVVVSVSASCGPVEEATVSDQKGEVVPMPTLPLEFQIPEPGKYALPETVSAVVEA